MKGLTVISEIKRTGNKALTQIKGYGVTAYILEDGNEYESFAADTSKGWETARLAYSAAVQAFNALVPIDQAIPTF